MEDTIAAIATPLGTGGLGIIRVSGAKAEYVARILFKPSKKITDFETKSWDKEGALEIGNRAFDVLRKKKNNQDQKEKKHQHVNVTFSKKKND